MARTTEQIYGELTQRYVAEMAAIGVEVVPADWSQVNLQRLLFYVVAICFKTIEELFDTHQADVNETIAQLKPHSTRWYALKGKAFQYGYNLQPESDVYNNTNLTAAQIAQSKIVKHSAVVEQLIGPSRYGLRIKVAKMQGTDLAPLSEIDELPAFKQYMERIKDAGVGLLITTGPADRLKLSLRIYYNPLVLNNQGQRLDGTANTPVQGAVNAFLLNLPFNGRFNLTELVDALQVVDGVDDPRLLSAQAQYAALPYTDITDEYIPDAGYLRLVDINLDLTIEWIPKIA